MNGKIRPNAPPLADARLAHVKPLAEHFLNQSNTAMAGELQAFRDHRGCRLMLSTASSPQARPRKPHRT